MLLEEDGPSKLGAAAAAAAANCWSLGGLERRRLSEENK
jgi:hypothetical protein